MEGSWIFLLILMYIFVPIIFIGGIVWLIIYLVRRKKKPGDLSGLEIWKRIGVGTVIAILSAFFIGFFTSAFFEVLKDSTAFIMMLMISIIFIIAGLLIMTRPVISYGLIAGAILNMIYNLALNAGNVEPAIVVVFVGIALAALIYISYKKLKTEEG